MSLSPDIRGWRLRGVRYRLGGIGEIMKTNPYVGWAHLATSDPDLIEFVHNNLLEEVEIKRVEQSEENQLTE